MKNRGRQESPLPSQFASKARKSNSPEKTRWKKVFARGHVPKTCDPLTADERERLSDQEDEGKERSYGSCKHATIDLEFRVVIHWFKAYY